MNSPKESGSTGAVRPPGTGSEPVGTWNKVENRGHFTKNERLYLVQPGRLPHDIIAGILAGSFPRIAINHGYFSNGDRLTHREEKGDNKYFITHTSSPQAEASPGVTSRKKELTFVEEAEFHSLWARTEGNNIMKKRYILQDGKVVGGPSLYLDVYEGDPAIEGRMVLDVVVKDPKEFEEFTPPEWCKPEPTEGILSEELAQGGRAVELLQESASLPEEIVLFHRS